MMTNDYFERDRTAALNALQKALSTKSKDAYDEAIAAATKFLNWLPKPPEPPAPTAQDLQARREARLYAEEVETMTPQERDVFNRLYGEKATIRRLAQAAQVEADRRWEEEQTARQDAEYRKTMFQGNLDQSKQPPTNYDRLQELSDQTSQRRLARLEARKQRELAAEIHDNDRSRVLASMDREEMAIFDELLNNLPSQLERLVAFKSAVAGNPLEGMYDSAELYKLAFQSDPATRLPPAPAPDITGIEDTDTLYDLALQELEEE